MPALAVALATFSVPLFGDPTPVPTPKPVESLTADEPRLMREALSPNSYAEVKTRRLTQARVVWLNYDLLREMGIAVPAEGLTPAFEKQVLDALGYAVPQKQDDAKLFGPEEKTFFADLYGGLGMNGNLGSGRAASRGEVQVKGIGVTPLVGKKVTDFGHAHGGASITEGVQEAIWGEVLNRETPNGASRVIAILSTGTFTHHPTWQEPRALTIRVDPLRPAHFLTNQDADGEEGVKDRSRVAEALKKLTQAFAPPVEALHKSPAEKLRAGMEDYVRKVGRQYGALYARRFFHGATSPSNMLADGGSLDFGTQTALPDWQKLQLLSDESYFGDLKMQQTDLIDQIVNDLGKNVPENLHGSIPTSAEAAKILQSAYDDSVAHEFVLLTGVPERVLKAMPRPQLLSELLQEIARAGHEEVNHHQGARPRKEGKYDLPKILVRLAETNGGEKEYERALAELIPEPALRTQLARAYAAFREEAATIAAKDGVSPKALATYFLQTARERNRSLPNLYIGRERWGTINRLIAQAGKQGDWKSVQEYIDGAVTNGIRYHRDARPYESVIQQFERPELGQTMRRVYDAATDRWSEVLILKPSSGKVSVLGQVFRAESLQGAKVAYRADGFARTAEAQWDGSVVRVRLPVAHRGSHLELEGLSDKEGRPLVAPSANRRCAWESLGRKP